MDNTQSTAIGSSNSGGPSTPYTDATHPYELGSFEPLILPSNTDQTIDFDLFYSLPDVHFQDLDPATQKELDEFMDSLNGDSFLTSDITQQVPAFTFPPTSGLQVPEFPALTSSRPIYIPEPSSTTLDSLNGDSFPTSGATQQVPGFTFPLTSEFPALTSSRPIYIPGPSSATLVTPEPITPTTEHILHSEPEPAIDHQQWPPVLLQPSPTTNTNMSPIQLLAATQACSASTTCDYIVGGAQITEDLALGPDPTLQPQPLAKHNVGLTPAQKHTQTIAATKHAKETMSNLQENVPPAPARKRAGKKRKQPDTDRSLNEGRAKRTVRAPPRPDEGAKSPPKKKKSTKRTK